MNDNQERETLCRLYFEAGMTHKEIVFTLAEKHNIILSQRHLGRILYGLNLCRRSYSDMGRVVQFIHNELQGSGILLGYRMMYQRCLNAKLRVRKEDVRTILKALDPEGVELRLTRRLSRRNYYAPGPNYIWHLDGYDKLKPYGLCISGCIDGFSRKIIWLTVSSTNNDPKLIGGYFLEAVSELNCVPCRVRGDFGTENGHVRDFLKLFREEHDDEFAPRPYSEGESTANQRIESWWGMLCRQCIRYYKDLFAEMHRNGEHGHTFLDKNLTRFCFTAIMQNELDRVVETWDAHRIRPSRNERVPSGRPKLMFSAPELWGATDKSFPLSEERLEVCVEEATFRSEIICDEDIYEMCCHIVARDNLPPVTDSHSAKDRYLHLRNVMNALIP